MEISIADQIALDDALVAPADRLKIGKCNLRLSSDVTSKEGTLQVVYDVLKLTPFYKAFQVTTDAPEIYMQEFWATTYVHNRSEILTFSSQVLVTLREIRKITVVMSINCITPWRSFAAFINKCLIGKPSYASLRSFSSSNSCQNDNAMYSSSFHQVVVNFVMDKDPSILEERRNEDTQLYGTILPVALTNEDIRNSESYKEYYVIASGTIPPKGR
ncbi:hypothetical protein Tco_0846975 [Tanacetum coccineum]